MLRARVHAITRRSLPLRRLHSVPRVTQVGHISPYSSSARPIVGLRATFAPVRSCTTRSSLPAQPVDSNARSESDKAGPDVIVKSAWEPPPSPSSNPKMFMVFTCGNCETRAVKSFSKSAYEKGVVLVQCPGCLKRHVVADHLGWFGEHKNIEEILKAKGQSVRKVTDADLEGLPEVGHPK